MISFNAKLAEVVARDPRFAYEAYEFIYRALDHTLKMLGKTADAEAGQIGHVTGGQLLEGIRSLARKDFGLMARTVFRQWGLRSSADFGIIVFNLVDAELLSKTEEDSLDDFRHGFDFDRDLLEGYEITLEEK